MNTPAGIDASPFPPSKTTIPIPPPTGMCFALYINSAATLVSSKAFVFCAKFANSCFFLSASSFVAILCSALNLRHMR